jgi:magnesium-transporting ATPase (P-type)
VPADILLLSSASSEKTCYLDTAAIDGETNLKQKSIPSCFLDVSQPAELSFELQCEPPNDDIYRFCGRVHLSTDNNPHPCDNNHFMLRGCVLRITEYVDGLIVYAGKRFACAFGRSSSTSVHDDCRQPNENHQIVAERVE